ncbi:MAG TPA: hypothetical protein VEH02_04110 [Pseudolabrys sp.]|nr:hypothetical protein [Pseudolabrys sp.]
MPGGQNFGALTKELPFVPIAVMVATVFLCSTAVAETSEERNACFNDAFRVCWSAIPDRDEVFHCLMDNRLRLNPLCRVVMDRYRHPHKHRITRRTRETRLQ